MIGGGCYNNIGFTSPTDDRIIEVEGEGVLAIRHGVLRGLEWSNERERSKLGA